MRAPVGLRLVVAAATGDVIDAASKKITVTLDDEDGRVVESERMIEVDVADGRPVRDRGQAGTGSRR